VYAVSYDWKRGRLAYSKIDKVSQDLTQIFISSRTRADRREEQTAFTKYNSKGTFIMVQNVQVIQAIHTYQS